MDGPESTNEKSCAISLRKILARANYLPAATPAAAATTVSAAIPAPATTLASTTAAAGMFGFWTRFIHVQRASSNLRAVQRGDRLIAIFVTSHLDEAEAAGASSLAVGHDADAIHWTEGFENLPEIFLRGIEIQVPHKNVFHGPPLHSLPRCQLNAVDWQVGDTFLKIVTGAVGS
jgi:hypothetical protein